MSWYSALRSTRSRFAACTAKLAGRSIPTAASDPWETQFGTELSQPGPTGFHGTPFFAVNGHFREEVDWGGDVSSQFGWLWRGNSGQVLRLGLHYFNGKSSQYQIFNQFEEQIGVGMWYDF